MVNTLSSRVGGTSDTTAEMRKEIIFPLSTMDEADIFEKWLNELANASERKDVGNRSQSGGGILARVPASYAGEHGRIQLLRSPGRASLHLINLT
ncbi:hypothetical protein AOLI_G00054640 [Acnodon oligacanthus]